MNIKGIVHTGHRSGRKAKSVAVNKVKYFIGKIGKVVSIDENAILKSKDWPYLWPKK